MSIRVNLKYDEFKKLRESFKEALNIMKGRVSPRYLEGFIYSLLSTLRSNDQSRFFHYLLTFLNTFENKEVSEFARELLRCLPMSESDFQKIGYMVVIGLMSIKGGE